MAAYQRGEGAAFDRLVALAGPALFRFLSYRAGERSLAEDLYQETWLKVHNARHTWRPGEPVRPWIYGIARHAFADHLRARARHLRRVEAVREWSDIGAAATRPGEPGALDEKISASQQLSQATAELPAAQAEALFLLKVEGLSVQEAAAIAGTSPGALKVRAHRAYAKVRAHLQASEEPLE